MAYARRAAILAEDLDEWWTIYTRRSATLDPWVYDSSQRAALEDRCAVLEDLVRRLRDISSELAALR
ncbi:MAG TPA: hypothetical protein VGH56_13170 [Solirubrobacteraceae bacterium]|jgi:hypothetical protein